ncbi:AMP-binding protein [Vibrio tubiashii]|uniref:AMP-binding protein n=1 Tax=Vibrio tubiashii TaxID=29498 RepID=UPI001EFCF12E|nr:AMP-binding protein [Vibrio tubiashii]MCG9583489.1 AMP-binding protein [Vibrio tubiashii]MCG9617066.1 AMP-binding protein [Vibrio tubiashii]MCG9686474.1 AMP-binding protein [Vibrio tubiashii]
MRSYEKPFIHHHFAEVAQHHDQDIAIADAHRQLSYGQLEALANRVANAIVQRHPHGSAPVIVYMQRTIEAVVTILAILKTGRPYLPVDDSFSESQLAFIAQDSHADCLISDRPLNHPPLPCYRYEDLRNHSLTVAPKIETPSIPPAYIMYTSGSTGRPKGVEIEHAGVLRLVHNSEQITCQTQDVVAHCSSIGFDASTLEIWLPLLNGAQIYVIPKQDVLDFEQFEYQINLGHVSTLWLTVALFNTIVTQHPKALSTLKTLIIGGDALNVNLVREFVRSEHCQLHTFLNGYGPTENTTFTTTFDIFDLDDEHTSVPIGRAITGTEVDIIDDQNQPVSGEQIGELITRGLGLARRYTCPHETQQKFFVYHGQRHYRTGDLVRRLPCGNIEFVSRKDHEVKIRGLRVNLTQVEQAFQQQLNVSQCYVRSDKTTLNERLVAYVEMTEPHPEQEPGLRQSVAEVLPTYMIPERLVLLSAIPLTRNGKLDIEAIEAQERQSASTPSSPAAPAGSILEKVHTLYQSVLANDGQPFATTRSFFELGGNSLQIYQLLNALNEEFHTKLTVKQVLDNPSIQALTTQIKQLAGDDNPAAPIPYTTGQPWPISPAQRRLWYVEKLRPLDNVLALGYTLTGELDVECLKAACHHTIRQHGIFHCRFVERSGEVQLEPAQHALDFQTLQSTDWQTIYEQEIATPFDCHNDPLLRVRLLTTGPNQHLLLLFSNHLILDGWSVQLLLQTISDHYECLHKGYPLSDTVQHDYRTYCLAMANQRCPVTMEKDLAFWNQHLFDCRLPDVLPKAAQPLPLADVKASVHSPRRVRLPRELSEKLTAQAKAEKISLFSLLTHHFGEALCQFSTLEEVVLAIPTANREGCANTIGMFVNTLPFRYHRDSDAQATHHTLQQCLSHAGTYLDEIQHHLNQQQSSTNLDALQVGIALQNTGHDQGLTLTHCDSQFFSLPTVSARFELFAHCFVANHDIEIEFEFDPQRLYPAYVESIHTLFTQRLMASVGLEASRPHGLGTLAPQRGPAYHPEPLQERLEKNWAPLAQQVAVITGKASYCYSQLSEDIQHLRQAFTRAGITQRQRIGIRLDLSYEYIVTVFALLLSGCSFVPLDRRYPQERLQFIIDDADLSGCLALSSPGQPNAPMANIGDCLIHFTSYTSTQSANGNEACLLYTSGSTGTPKGVEICLDSILRLTQSPNFLQLAQETRFLVASSPAFDASLLEIFVPLVNGLSCAVVEKETLLDYPKFSRELARQGINTAWLTVSLFNDIATTRPQTLRHLTGLMIGGDALNLSTVRAFLDSPHCHLTQFVNGYGPTETTTFATWFDILSLHDAHNSVPIGQAINDTHVYLLDAERHPCQCGQVGEIVIGAPWLRPNYHNRPELNQEKYRPNPYYPLDGCRYVYLSGDLGRYNPQGDIEYIGRRDHLVKVRGHRVELSGINHILLAHPMVKNAHVGIVENPDKHIVAYLVPNDTDVEVGDMRSVVMSYLRNTLEPFQVPSGLVFVEHLPLTINGKVDQRALSQYQFEPSEACIPPRNELETQIHRCWAEFIHDDQFCVTARFFDIGGHSLLVPKVLHRLSDLIGQNIAFVDFLRHQTVAELALWLSERSEKNQDELVSALTLRRSQQAHYPVTPAQLNLYFSHEFTNHKALYNIPQARLFDNPLRAVPLQQAVKTLMQQNRVLNTVFAFDEQDNLHMKVRAPQDPEFTVHPVDSLDDAITLCQTLAESPFALLQGPLIRFDFMPIAETDQSVVFINIHHIIADEASMQFLFEALMDIYHQGQSPRSEYDFLDYSHAVTATSPAEHDKALRAFWTTQFSGYEGILKFTANERTDLPDNLGFRQQFDIEAPVLHQLTELANAAQGTLFETALALYQTAASQVAKHRDIVIGFPYSPRVDIDLLDTIGYFVDVIPTRVSIPDANTSISDIHERIETNRAFLAHRPINQTISYVSDIRRCYNYAPLVQNVFAFHDQDSAISPVGQSLELDNRYCRFDTVFTVFINNGRGTVVVECAQDLYSYSLLQRLFNAFVDVIQEASSTITEPLLTQQSLVNKEK